MENDIYTTALLAMGGLLVGLGLVVVILWGSAAWERRRRLSRRRGSRPLSFIFAASEWDPGGPDAQIGGGHGGWGDGHGGGGDGGH